MKKWFLLLCTLPLLWACSDEDPGRGSTNVYMIIINNISYNIEEDAYVKLEAYLEYLETYYSNKENSEEIIKGVEKLLGEGVGSLLENEEDVITISDVEYVIDNIKKQENSIAPNVPTLEEVGKAPLTILAYLIANNNLDDFLSYNIGIMYDGLAAMDKPATLLVYWDGKTTIGENSASHLILRYETDGEGNVNGLPKVDTSSSLTEVLEIGEIVKEYPNQVSTSSSVMTNVLNDMLGEAPTERIGLVFGSHGSAWLNTIYTRAFGQDGSGTNNTIQISDMASALKATNRTFDFILFDACYMGTVEVCYEFREVADYQIVSAMEVPAYGFPYDMFMANLYEGTPDGYQKACETYFDYYNQLYVDGSSNTWGTVALVESKEMQAMVAALKEEIVNHKNVLADYDATVLQEYGRSSGRYISFDMGQLVKDLNDGSIPDKFRAQLDKTVVYKECMEKANPSSYSVDVSNFCGLGMYLPVKTKSAWNEYFKTTSWYTVSGWNEVTFSWDF